MIKVNVGCGNNFHKDWSNSDAQPMGCDRIEQWVARKLSHFRARQKRRFTVKSPRIIDAVVTGSVFFGRLVFQITLKHGHKAVGSLVFRRQTPVRCDSVTMPEISAEL
jgi:hypothetical protein